MVMSVSSKMTALANSIRAKAGANGLLSIDDMRDAVDSIQTGSSSLPSAYTEYEYLESSGTQCIAVTGVWLKQSTELLIDFVLLKSSINYPRIFGFRGTTKLSAVYTGATGVDVSLGASSIHNKTTEIYLVMTTEKGFQINKDYIDKLKIPASEYVYAQNILGWYPVMNDSPREVIESPDCPLFLFSYSSDGTIEGDITKTGNMRIYHVTLKESGTVVADLYPAMRNSDQKLGLYDAVRNMFFTNIGMGEFTGGALE